MGTFARNRMFDSSPLLFLAGLSMHLMDNYGRVEYDENGNIKCGSWSYWENDNPSPSLHPSALAAIQLSSFRDLLKKFGEAGNNPYSDPLIVNLKDDKAVTTTSIENGAFFDLDKNGFAEKTGWITAGEAFVVRDVNGDGTINNGGELFGDQTVKMDGRVAASGFEALREFDSNQDGFITAEDEKADTLRVWKDDGDGVTEAGELKTFAEAGVKSISLSATEIKKADQSENIVMREANVIMANDDIHKAAEYLFKRDTLNTENPNELSGTGNENSILEGYGNVPDLSTSMEQDPVLKQMVEEFMVYPISNQEYPTSNEIGTETNNNQPSTINGILNANVA